MEPEAPKGVPQRPGPVPEGLVAVADVLAVRHAVVEWAGAVQGKLLSLAARRTVMAVEAVMTQR